MTPDADAKSSYLRAGDEKPAIRGMDLALRFVRDLAELAVAAAMVWVAVTAWREEQDIWFAIAIPLASHAIARFAREDRT